MEDVFCVVFVLGIPEFQLFIRGNIFDFAICNVVDNGVAKKNIIEEPVFNVGFQDFFVSSLMIHRINTRLMKHVKFFKSIFIGFWIIGSRVEKSQIIQGWCSAEITGNLQPPIVGNLSGEVRLTKPLGYNKCILVKLFIQKFGDNLWVAKTNNTLFGFCQEPFFELHGIYIDMELEFGFKKWLESFDLSEPQQQTLQAMQSRAPKFQAWLRAFIGDDFQQAWDDPSLRLDYFRDYLHEEHYIGVRDDGLIEFWTLDGTAQKLIGNLPVVVYHYTSDKLDKKVRSQGLRADVKSVNPYKNSRAGVYVTTEQSGPAVDGYISMAIQAFGGNTRVWTIKTTLQELRPDPDDHDLSSGRHQFVLPYVKPQDLVEAS